MFVYCTVYHYIYTRTNTYQTNITISNVVALSFHRVFTNFYTNISQSSFPLQNILNSNSPRKEFYLLNLMNYSVYFPFFSCECQVNFVHLQSNFTAIKFTVIKFPGHSKTIQKCKNLCIVKVFAFLILQWRMNKC